MTGGHAGLSVIAARVGEKRKVKRYGTAKQTIAVPATQPEDDHHIGSPVHAGGFLRGPAVLEHVVCRRQAYRPSDHVRVRAGRRAGSRDEGGVQRRRLHGVGLVLSRHHGGLHRRRCVQRSLPGAQRAHGHAEEPRDGQGARRRGHHRHQRGHAGRGAQLHVHLLRRLARRPHGGASQRAVRGGAAQPVRGAARHAAALHHHRPHPVLLLQPDAEGEQLADELRQGQDEEVHRGAPRREVLRRGRRRRGRRRMPARPLSSSTRSTLSAASAARASAAATTSASRR